MEKYVFLKSSDSVRYFPDNKPYNFRVHLENNIDLRGYWKIGISEFFTLASPKKIVMDKTTSKPISTFQNKPIFVYSNICDFSNVGGEEQPLLRVIQADPSYGWNDKFYPVYYIPLRTHNLSDIHFYLKDDRNSLATFIDSDVWMTLHLIRYPF